MFLIVVLACILFAETVFCFFVAMALAGVYKTARTKLPKNRETLEVDVSINSKAARRELEILQERADNLLRSMRAINEMAETKAPSAVVDQGRYVKEQTNATG